MTALTESGAPLLPSGTSVEGAAPGGATPSTNLSTPAGGKRQAFPASMAWRASIIFCADSSISMTSESIRETK